MHVPLVRAGVVEVPDRTTVKVTTEAPPSCGVPWGRVRSKCTMPVPGSVTNMVPTPALGVLAKSAAPGMSNSEDSRTNLEKKRGSSVTCCLLSVGTDQVWAGSFDTTIYIIDINTHTANKQLLDHVDMVSDLTISQDGSTVYSASLNGQILLWSAATLQKQGQIWLKNVQRLVSIRLVGQNLWCCTKSALLLVDREGQTLHTLQMTDEGDSPLQIECFLLSQDGMLWAGSGNQGRLTVWDSQSYSVVKNISVSCRGLSKMVQTHGKIWVGGKCGNIHIFNQGTYTEEKELVAHEDAIRSMCAAFDRYIMTGSGSKDGKIAIWRV
ncbi:Rab guanyl-nucleotide exchange factor [Branchiostoma belcheri]|nr:Rab guanyl-nucleotide exchange factor [Branchiostoma belcheri]